MSLHYSNTAKAPRTHDEHDAAHFSCSDCWLTASLTLLFLQCLNLLAFCPFFLILLFHSMFYLSLILPAYISSAPPPPPACCPPPDPTAATYPAGSGSAPGSCCPAVNCCSCCPGCCSTTSQPAAAKPVPAPTTATTITQTGANHPVCPTTAGSFTINPAHSPSKRPSTTNVFSD